MPAFSIQDRNMQMQIIASNISDTENASIFNKMASAFAFEDAIDATAADIPLARWWNDGGLKNTIDRTPKSSATPVHSAGCGMRI